MSDQQWHRSGASIPLKAFRSIAATLLESHAGYGRVTNLYLGHSPRSLRERQYAAALLELLHKGLGWLREQAFTCKEQKSP